MTISDPFEAITVGQEAELVHVVSEADLDTFARLTGDNNPLHMDEDFASSTTFKKRVVHGMLTASFISTIIGTRLPGPGSLWYEQHLRFLHAVRIGERIRVWAKVTQKSPGQRVLTLDTIVFGEGDRRVIEGEAKVRMLEVQTEEATAQVRAQGAVIVSGASRGIGAAVARELGLAGFPVIVNYSRSEAPANEIVREIVAAGGRATAYRASVTDRATVDQMVAAAHGEYGALAGVVNNAAPEMRFADFADLAWEDIQQQIDVQIRGAFNLCQAAAPALIEAGGGVMVNITSIITDNAPPLKLLPYSMAKSALASLTRSLAVELGPKGIRVNSVSPGMTETDLILEMPEKAKLIEKMRTPLRRLALPDDIGGVVAFLFSEKARHIAGENIRVCGGAVMS